MNNGESSSLSGEQGASLAERLSALEAELRETRARLLMTTDALAQAEARLGAGRERETFLRSELLHRVRNMLATIRIVFSRTAELGQSLDSVTSHFLGRLDALARYQTVSAITHGASVDLGTIIYDELLTLGLGDDERIVIEGLPAAVSQTVAQTLGLAVHELATNSVKFGVLGAEHGRLHISWSLEGELLTISWVESGVSVLRPAPLPRGFGREFIEQGLPYQLGAHTSFAIVPGGIECVITVSSQIGETVSSVAAPSITSDVINE